MTLLAFAADRHAAMDMDRKAAVPAADMQIDVACLHGPQQQTRRSPLHRPCRILCEQCQ